MTIKQLIKKLQEIDKANPDKRLKVAIDIQSARDSVNDCFTVVPISDFKVDHVEKGDGDGWGTGRYEELLLMS